MEKVIKRIFATLLSALILCSAASAQWRGGEGQNRLGTGLKDAPNADSGVWYPTGLIDWIFVENLAKERAKAKGHPQRWKEYLIRFMPEPQPLNVAPPANPPFDPPVIIPDPVQPPPPPPPAQPDFKWTYWAPKSGIYKPGNPTNGDPYLSDNGKLKNPYREIRFVKILYRGAASMESYHAAVKEVLAQCRDKDQTFEQGADGKFTVMASKDIGPNRKAIFVWTDDISKDYGFVLVDEVANGRINCILNSGDRKVAVANPSNFYDWYLGSYIGEISSRGPSSGSRLAVVPTGKRNKLVSIQLWMHQGDIAASFRLRDFQEGQR